VRIVNLKLIKKLVYSLFITNHFKISTKGILVTAANKILAVSMKSERTLQATQVKSLRGKKKQNMYISEASSKHNALKRSIEEQKC
jgi:hypothetical protein